MGASAQILIHSSQFPDRVRRELLNCLRRRIINPKFHYESIKQTSKWLRVHRSYAPSKTDQDCRAIYQQSFAAAAAGLGAGRAHLVGLGCGSGEKEAEILRLLKKSNKKLSFTPVDVSLPLVLRARQVARKLIEERNCFPIVCDLSAAADLPQLLHRMRGAQSRRLYTFFGMIPNFEPQVILPRLASLIGPADWLLFSANLAPGSNYTKGVEKILPLYDNDLTRDWLLTFLLDLGVKRSDGQLTFRIEEDRSRFKRISAYFEFSKRTEVEIDGRPLRFDRGETIRLFFSYRYPPTIITSLLQRHDVQVVDQWITKSQEEGVFLCRRA